MGAETLALPRAHARNRGLADRIKDIVITALVTTIVVASLMYNFSRGELRDTQNLIKNLTVPALPTAFITPETTLPPKP